MSDIPLKKPQLAEAMNWSVRQIEHFMHEGLPFIPYGKRQKRFDLESVKKMV